MKHVITTFFLLITVLVVYPQQMGNLINQQVILNSSQSSEQYAVAILDGVPTIASVSPIPFNNYVSALLTDNAVADMSISIVPVVNNVSPIVQSISEGCNNVMINTASLPAGQYILCLMHNNTVVRSMNIIKAVQ